ncbi:MAG: hypothetical protein J6X62_00925 [Bacteroidales bacterium]|nr:hypothetical protein [Bacteroidales bacterium]
MRFKCLYIIALLLLCGMGVRAQLAAGARLEVTESAWSHVGFEWEVWGDADSALSGMHCMLLAVPEGARLRVEIEEDATEPLREPYYGIRRSHWKGDGREAGIAVNSLKEPVTVEEIGVMRGVRVARLTVWPVTHGVQGKVLHSRVAGTVHFDGADMDASIAEWRRLHSDVFIPFMKQLSNGNIYSNVMAGGDGRECMALVAPAAYRSLLQPLVQWHRQTGTDVVEYYFNAEYCESAAIAAWLAQRYRDADGVRKAPSMVLLAGDAMQIPLWPCRHRPSGLPSYRTDLYYGEFTGDYLPEMLVGRLSVSDTSELRGVVAKTLAYELLEGIDTAYMREALLVAGRELRDPAVDVTNGFVNYLGELFAMGPSAVDTHCFYNPASDSLLPQISTIMQRGQGLVAYSAHCTTQGWLNPTLTGAMVDSMEANGRYAFVVNNCCLSNQVGSDCMGEHLLRKAGGGAIGVIGAASETLWEEDYYWAVGGQRVSAHPSYFAANMGAYDRMAHRHGEPFAEQAVCQGQILAAGNFAVSRYGSPYDAYYWEIYNLLGDPFLMPRVGGVSAMPLTAYGIPMQGGDSIAVRGRAGARVAAVQNGSLLGCTYIDSTGKGTVITTTPVGADTLTLTATMQGCAPAVCKVVPVEPNGGRLAVERIGWRDSAAEVLCIAWRNYGRDTIMGHRVALFTAEGDTVLPYTVIDSLPPHGQRVLEARLRRVLRGSVLELRSIADDGAVQYWSHDHIVALNGVALEPRITLVESNGDAARRIHAGRDYMLRIEMNNDGETVVDSVLVDVNLPTGGRFTGGGTLPACIVGLGADSTALLQLPVHTDDTLRGLEVRVEWRCRGVAAEATAYFVAGYDVETFERGDFGAYGWNTRAPHPWTIDSVDTVHVHAARSAAINDKQVSDLSIELDVCVADSLTFWVKTSSERNRDKLVCYIDDAVAGSWSGINDWTQAALTIDAGIHRVMWRYQKDDYGSDGDDCAWIDDIRFPLCRYADAAVGYGNSDTALVGITQAEKPAVDGRLTVWPNPVRRGDDVAVSADSRWESMLLFDNQGRMAVWEPRKTINATATQYSTAMLRCGVYYVVAQCQDKCVVGKIVVID